MRASRHTSWLVLLLVALGTIFILFPLYMTVAIALKNPEQMAHSDFADQSTENGTTIMRGIFLAIQSTKRNLHIMKIMVPYIWMRLH
ncbi:hypothetical protein B4V02_01130 [Paenibacillus kribbensis]|uniref:Uncharacterized protein n=1 Tax=Paenibacillus kribbensis TaxID=172713 RepID=A0A222WGZ9_9BACL|nr:hypothetical protein [Paenibacillus kribbensis]ASR45406.1 hypothetical protein B4V02_01130 [Paenibacillus kribbensis]